MATNGRLALSNLVRVDGWAYLAPATAAAWTAVSAEMYFVYGVARPRILAPDGAYRTFERQQYWKKYWTSRGWPGNAATPGRSNHGWGTAVDIENYEQNRAILARVLAKYGFTFNVPSERWHVQHNGMWPTTPAATAYKPIQEEDDMTPEQDQMLRSIYRALFEIPVDDFAKRPSGLGRAIKDIRDALFLNTPTSFGTPAGVLGTLKALVDKLGRG